MFDHTFKFEELPIRIADQQVAFVSGSALLELDEGYDFVVTGITVDKEDGGVIQLSERSDDAEKISWFRKLSAEIYKDEAAEEEFASALAERRLEVA